MCACVLILKVLVVMFDFLIPSFMMLLTQMRSVVGSTAALVGERQTN